MQLNSGAKVELFFKRRFFFEKVALFFLFFSDNSSFSWQILCFLFFLKFRIDRKSLTFADRLKCENLFIILCRIHKKPTYNCIFAFYYGA